MPYLLNDNDVHQICKMLDENKPQNEISDEIGISRATVSDIYTGKTHRKIGCNYKFSNSSLWKKNQTKYKKKTTTTSKPSLDTNSMSSIRMHILHMIYTDLCNIVTRTEERTHNAYNYSKNDPLFYSIQLLRNVIKNKKFSDDEKVENILGNLLYVIKEIEIRTKIYEYNMDEEIAKSKMAVITEYTNDKTIQAMLEHVMNSSNHLILFDIDSCYVKIMHYTLSRFFDNESK